MNTLAELRRRFAAALSQLDPASTDLADLVLPNHDPRFGDYQANCAMPLGKRLGESPRAVAERLVERLACDDLCAPPEIAGPGFINLRLDDAWIQAQLLSAYDDSERAGVERASELRTYVLDFSSPNVAKPMHVGHIRSTVIGDALCRMLRFLGHRVISDNHIGDWGTQFGMILYGYKHFVDRQRLESEPVAELSRLYRLVNQLAEYQAARDEKLPALEGQLALQTQKMADVGQELANADSAEEKQIAKRARQLTAQRTELAKQRDALLVEMAKIDHSPQLTLLVADHPDIRQAVLRETAALHAGDATNRALWKQFLPWCRAEMEEVYERLGVTFDFTLGESFYQNDLADVVADLARRGIARESDGALCVFLTGMDAPLIVQKKDGAFLYATTDLATIDYRLRTWRPDAILYVVDHRQSLHFEQLFAAARLWRATPLELTHISFGTILDEYGKPYKTRSGSAVGLAGLLDEAVARAHALVCANDEARTQPLLSQNERLLVAQKVGIGAIKYADLAHNRTSDYEFSYDKMLAMRGNTAAYMQYSYARVQSIFEKGEVDLDRLRRDRSDLTFPSDEERSLALALLRFEEALVRATSDYRPNHLTDYLFDLASRFAAFFENCPVLKAATLAERTNRLRLCDLTARILSQGLQLLGIEVVERM